MKLLLANHNLRSVLPMRAASNDDDDLQNGHLPAVFQPKIQNAVSRRIQDAFENMQFGLEEWLSEVRAVAQAAALQSHFDTALKAYEMLGRHLGARITPEAQAQIHNHLHLPPGDHHALREASTEDLQSRLLELREATAAPTNPNDDFLK